MLLFTRADTTVVRADPQAVKAHFQFAQWPEGESQVDPGGRSITLLPLPGHERAPLAFYDQRSGTIFSGDTLYPGFLTVRDWPAYRRSIARLLKFAETHPVTAFAGAHIKPNAMYPLGTDYHGHRREAIGNRQVLAAGEPEITILPRLNFDPEGTSWQ